MKRINITSGSTFEHEIGYSRAVVQDGWIFVSGTTGFDYQTMTISNDLAIQTEHCILNIRTALQTAGADLKDIVRITYIVPESDRFAECWPILQKYFGGIRPAATMFSAKLADPRMQIEIEVTAKQP